MVYSIEYKERELAPEAIHEAVVYGWEDFGMRPTNYGDKHRAAFKYESLTHRMSDGKAFTIYDFMNVAFGEKATLSQRYQQIMGKPLLGDTFDPNEVMCVKVQLYIVHNVDPKIGRTYANIAKVKRCEVQDVDPADLENEVSVVEALDKDLTGVN